MFTNKTSLGLLNGGSRWLHRLASTSKKNRLSSPPNSPVLTITKSPERRHRLFSSSAAAASALTAPPLPESPPLLSLNSFLSNPSQTQWQEHQQEVMLQPQKMLGSPLPVLEAVYNYLKSLPENERPNFERTLFICGEHLLESTVTLFEYYIKLGARPENIYVIGKSYSSNDNVIAKLKKLRIQHAAHIEQDMQDTIGAFSEAYDSDIVEMLKEISRRLKVLKGSGFEFDGVIVADDGGHVLGKIRSHKYLRAQLKYIIGVEQTSSGITVSKETQYPVIELATSAVKRVFEPPMVSEKVMSVVKKRMEEVVTQLKENKYEKELKGCEINFPLFLESEKLRCGIVGLGSIGIAVLDSLIQLGYKEFLLFDMNMEKTNRIVEEYQVRYKEIKINCGHSILGVLGNADIIAGCTGKDITSELIIMDAFNFTKTPKILFSCTSKDKEFLTLLKHIQVSRRTMTNPRDDILYKNGYEAPLLILRGGFPLNFDNSEISVPNHLIQVIRGLKLMAAFQAYQMLKDLREEKLELANYKLDPGLQEVVIRKFLEDQPSAIKYCAEEVRNKLTDVNGIGELSSGKPYSMGVDSPVSFNDVMAPGRRQ